MTRQRIFPRTDIGEIFRDAARAGFRMECRLAGCRLESDRGAIITGWDGRGSARSHGAGCRITMENGFIRREVGRGRRILFVDLILERWIGSRQTEKRRGFRGEVLEIRDARMGPQVS
jgi:hypothetical protein